MRTTSDEVHATGISKEDLYYDKGGIMSRNGLINFVIGGRGVGKTFDFKKWAMTKDSETIWVRRYKEDIETGDFVSKFLDDLYQEGVLDPYDESKIITTSSLGVAINGEIKIHFVPLSTSRKKKSIPYPKVNHIIFDEVFEGVGGGRYLKDEVKMLLELIETVNRLRLDGRPEVRVFLLSNNTTFVNPYFQYFGILPFTERYKSFKNGLVVVENYRNEKFEEVKRSTKFGQLIDGTEYGDYAIGNEVWLDDNAFLEPRHPKSRLAMNIRLGEEYIGLWTYEGIVYCSKAHNKTAITYSNKYETRANERVLAKNKPPLKDLIDLYNIACLRFDNNIIKYQIFELMQNR